MRMSIRTLNYPHNLKPPQLFGGQPWTHPALSTHPNLTSISSQCLLNISHFLYRLSTAHTENYYFIRNLTLTLIYFKFLQIVTVVRRKGAIKERLDLLLFR